MATRRPRKPRRDPYRWFQVHSSMWCARGEHEVSRGTWMRTRRDDHRELHSCDACLLQIDIRRPGSEWTFHGEGEDLRAKRAGGNE